MSRIDQALTMWEGEKAVVATDSPSDDSKTVAALNLYPQEHTERHEPKEERVETTAPEPQVPAQRVAESVAKPVHAKSRTHADIRARLVTSALNTVSIEQYRRLAAVLHDIQVEKHLKTVMITSAVPQEGKTLTIVNLALTLAESYARRVLMIDADLRWPSVHRVVDIANGRGLSEALREPRHELPIVEISDRLSVLTAGHPGPMPLAGLSSPRMGEIVEECAARFDWVLIDTSPVGILPDASVLARLVGGVIFVIRAGSTPGAAVERAIAEIGSDAIVGTVLNRVEERRIPAAGYYNQYSGAAAGRR